jgi:hypothetical protein
VFIFTYQIVLGLIIPLVLVWIFFRYFIRLVKSNESIADSMEEINESLKSILEKPDGKGTKDDTIEK